MSAEEIYEDIRNKGLLSLKYFKVIHEKLENACHFSELDFIIETEHSIVLSAVNKR